MLVWQSACSKSPVSRPQQVAPTVDAKVCSTCASPVSASVERGLTPETVSLGTTLLRVMFSWMLQGFPLIEMLVGERSCTKEGVRA